MANITTHHGFMHRISQIQAGGAGPKATLLALAQFAGYEDGEWRCYPGQDLLGQITEQSTRTVRRHLDDLVARGIIEVEGRGNTQQHGGRQSNTYRFKFEDNMSSMEKPDEELEDKSASVGGHLVSSEGTEQPVIESPPTPPPMNRLSDLPTPESIRMRRSRYPLEFEAAWAAYPRKDEKSKAYKAWRTRMTDAPKQGVDIHRRCEAMVTAASNYAEDCEDHNREQEHIKLCATFYGPSEPWRDWVKRAARQPVGVVPSYATGQMADDE